MGNPLAKLERPPGVKERHFAFVLALLGDPERNKTRAALAAGYGESSAPYTGSELAKHPKLAPIIAEGERLIAQQFEVTPTRLLKGLLAMAELDLSDIYDDQGRLLPLKDWPEGARRSVQGLESREATIFEESEDGQVAAVPAEVRKARLPDRIRAYELAARIAGVMAPDRATTAPPAVQIVQVMLPGEGEAALPVEAEVRELPAAAGTNVSRLGDEDD